MKTMTNDQFVDAMKAQGVRREDVTFECPRCKTLQSAQDLIDAGAGSSLEEVETFLAFSCVGRFQEGNGCTWTLGGLFKLHELEVIAPDGKRHPRFLPKAA